MLLHDECVATTAAAPSPCGTGGCEGAGSAWAAAALLPRRKVKDEELLDELEPVLLSERRLSRQARMVL